MPLTALRGGQMEFGCYMGIISHAQNFEDVMLWRAVGDVEKGRYLDIGAQDPFHDSVSLAFYERGWRGVHVEPMPTYAQQIRAARHDEIVIEAAVSTSPGPIEFFAIDDTGLSTGDAAIAKGHEKRGFFARKIVVPTVRLDGIFDQFEQLHWLKIDVEGMEKVVLNSWGDHPLRPWIVLVEATKPMEQEAGDLSWRRSLLDRGYKEVYFDGLNRFFVHSDHAQRAKAFKAPPSVFDEFGLSDTHFAAKAIVADGREAQNAATARIDELSAALEKQADDLASSEAKRSSVEADLQAKQEELDYAHHVAAEYRKDALARADELARQTATYADRIETLFADRIKLERDFAEQAAAAADHHAADRERRRLEHEARERELSAAAAESEQVKVLLEQRLALVHGSIRAAIAAPISRGSLLARLFGLGREDPVKARLEAALPLFDGHPATVSELPMSPPLMTNRNPYLRANSLAELLAWDDVDFVRCAYVTVLGRQPDPGGEFNFTNRLRMGDSKFTILWNLRRSAEGSGHDPGIAGLDRRLKREALRRNRFYGWLVRVFVPGEGASKSDRRFRQLHNSLAILRAQQARQTDALSAIGHRGAELSEGFQSLSVKLDRIGDQVLRATQGEPAQTAPRDLVSERQTDQLDLSSRERQVIQSLKAARY